MSDTNEFPQPGRRAFMIGSGLAFGTLSPGFAAATEDEPLAEKFKFCLNMSTIRGQELDAAEEIEIAGKAGYDSIEPWFRKITEYLENGGSLTDLRKRIDDHGLTVESAIGFAKWIVDDPTERAAGLEEAKRDMDTVAQLGGVRIAAPPAGVPQGRTVSLDDAADRYRALLELGDEMGVVPQIEMWGGNPTVGTVEKALYVAARAGHSKACFLGDVYHTYKGGSSFDSILLMGPRALRCYHMNDYPADPPRDAIRDGDRVFPGDGIAPLAEIIGNFRSVGAYPALSLELFNPSYWEMPALECAKTGLEKMKAAVAEASV
ncbi:MAG: sugar phosphate isomerase/epimerase family protein [Verrucomicrobiales bacterium]